jgi:hypothetical protein
VEVDPSWWGLEKAGNHCHQLMRKQGLMVSSLFELWMAMIVLLEHHLEMESDVFEEDVEEIQSEEINRSLMISPI